MARRDVVSDLFLGHHYSQTIHTFDGSLDQIGLYNRGLSQAEIFQLYLYGF